MEGREGIDLTKMAITAMMITLVLSGFMLLFYFLFGFLNQKTSNYANIAAEGSNEKLNSLDQLTKSGKRPPVTDAINALSDLTTTDVAYFEIVNETGTSSMYFTYNGITLTGVVGQVVPSDSPSDGASQYLMGFSDRRCAFEYIKGIYTAGGADLDCVRITLMPEGV